MLGKDYYIAGCAFTAQFPTLSAKMQQTDTVVCYCHYCLEGLIMGGKNGKHMAELLFN